MNILVINDFTSAGNVSINAIKPILDYFKHSVYAVPTCILSSPLDFKVTNKMNMTDYLKECLDTYDKLNIHFDWCMIGYIADREQMEIIKNYIMTHDMKYLIDPIMADGGHYYHGMGEENARYYRSLLDKSDILIPNLTELCFLLNEPFKEDMTYKEVMELLNKCDFIKKLIVTSIKMNDNYFIFGKDEKSFNISYDHIPVRFGGPGDIFSAFVISYVLKGNSLKLACIKANLSMELLLENNLRDFKDIPEDHSKLLLIEPYLNEIEKKVEGIL